MEEIAKIEQILKSIGHVPEQIKKWTSLFSVLTKSPELEAGAHFETELFCVVLLGSGYGVNHNYTTDYPMLVAGFTGKNPVLFDHSNGKTNQWSISYYDCPRYATNDEIETMVRGLSQAQWREIYTNQFFAPLLDEAFGRIVLVPNDDSNGSERKTEEIQLPDGRMITMENDNNQIPG